VWGVDQNIYSHLGPQQATGAGWLILAIIDLLWIVFFTSPPHSPVFTIVDSLSASRARRQEARQNKVEKIERSADAFTTRRQESRQNSGDAFALSHLHGGGGGSTRGDVRASRGSGPPRLPDQQNPRVTGGDWALYTPPQKSGGRGTITSITSEPKSATASGRVKSVAEESRESGRAGSGRAESGRADSGRAESGRAGPDEALSQKVASESPKAQWKAEALFPCMCFVLQGSFLTEFCA
jgi:SHO1 osmosensor